MTIRSIANRCVYRIKYEIDSVERSQIVVASDAVEAVKMLVSHYGTRYLDGREFNRANIIGMEMIRSSDGYILLSE